MANRKLKISSAVVASLGAIFLITGTVTNYWAVYKHEYAKYIHGSKIHVNIAENLGLFQRCSKIVSNYLSTGYSCKNVDISSQSDKVKVTVVMSIFAIIFQSFVIIAIIGNLFIPRKIPQRVVLISNFLTSLCTLVALAIFADVITKGKAKVSWSYGLEWVGFVITSVSLLLVAVTNTKEVRFNDTIHEKGGHTVVVNL